MENKLGVATKQIPQAPLQQKSKIPVNNHKKDISINKSIPKIVKKIIKNSSPKSVVSPNEKLFNKKELTTNNF